MPIKSLNPYLGLNGNAEEAIRHYEKTLGARIETMMRWGDVPEMGVAPEHKSRIMHALLHLDDGVIMIADTPPHTPSPPESNVQVCLHFDDVADMARKFEALSTGGKVTMQLQDTFWGARFGMLTDAYGIRWMFNCELKKP
jgi:PhnB protein